MNVLIFANLDISQSKHKLGEVKFAQGTMSTIGKLSTTLELGRVLQEELPRIPFGMSANR
jgi:hypothetical protein